MVIRCVVTRCEAIPRAVADRSAALQIAVVDRSAAADHSVAADRSVVVDRFAAVAPILEVVQHAVWISGLRTEAPTWVQNAVVVGVRTRLLVEF